MDITEIENALNELIIKATLNEGFVWIVDKKGNNFAIRLNAPVKLRAYTFGNNERKENGNNDNNEQTN